MKKFSERKGFKAVSEIIQTESIRDELRNLLWNVLDMRLWSTDGYLYKQYGEAEIEPFIKYLFNSYFKKSIDTIPDRNDRKLKFIRDYFFQCAWYEIYDFLEAVVTYYNRYTDLCLHINVILEQELSGYRLISGNFVDITDKQEIDMLEEALKDTKYEGVTAHLFSALKLLSDRDNPDYRNSIKESISAVESLAKVISGDPKATLGEAFRELEKSGKLHPSLKNGFIMLYGYTNNEGGIRHAMLSEPNIDVSDAKFFLLSCTSFVNYLKSKI